MQRILVILLILSITVNSHGDAVKARAVPITINARVMRHLHQALANPHARLKMREMLDRLEIYRPMIEAKLTEAQLPKELIAIPVVESMYRANATSTASAGLWQLLPETARRYGLKVDDDTDERFDAEKETTAAIAYLKYIHEQTGDWSLAILSYNAGESKVRRLTRQTGVKDVFKLAEQGHLKNEENTNYVSKIMAAMIVIDHPQLVSN